MQLLGLAADFRADLAYHPSVCSHFYSWGSAWWVWRRPGCILQLPNDCTNRLDCELVQETESTFPGELSTFEQDIDEINQFECEEVRERTLSEDEFETDTFMYERFVVDDDETGSDIFSACENIESADTEYTSEHCDGQSDDMLFAGTPISSSSSVV